MHKEQRLYWSASRPLRWLGLTLDEWAIMFVGVIPGIFIVNGGDLKVGGALIMTGCSLCYAFKKFKNLSQHFLVKSYLLSKGLIPPPSKSYPNLHNERVYK